MEGSRILRERNVYKITDGKPISAEEFLNNLFGELANFFKDEAELRQIWSNPSTRKTLLEKLAEAGLGNEELSSLMQKTVICLMCWNMSSTVR